MGNYYFFNQKNYTNILIYKINILILVFHELFEATSYNNTMFRFCFYQKCWYFASFHSSMRKTKVWFFIPMLARWIFTSSLGILGTWNSEIQCVCSLISENYFSLLIIQVLLLFHISHSFYMGEWFVFMGEGSDVFRLRVFIYHMLQNVSFILPNKFSAISFPKCILSFEIIALALISENFYFLVVLSRSFPNLSILIDDSLYHPFLFHAFSLDINLFVAEDNTYQPIVLIHFDSPNIKTHTFFWYFDMQPCTYFMHFHQIFIVMQLISSMARFCKQDKKS